MIPKSIETPRLLDLRAIVEAATPEGMFKWPLPTHDDLALFGRIIVLYSSLDFALRFIAAVMDEQKMLLAPWAGKTSKLT